LRKDIVFNGKYKRENGMLKRLNFYCFEKQKQWFFGYDSPAFHFIPILVQWRSGGRKPGCSFQSGLFNQ